MQIKNCLFDLDGTLCDHTAALMRDLAKIQSPHDPPVRRHDDTEPDWIKERKRLIRSQPGWWRNLDQISLGFDVYQLAHEIGFRRDVLTKGPWTCTNAWSEKVEWCRKFLMSDTKIVITEDKSLVYGRVLVDDYIPYVVNWLNVRPRGVVIMVAQEENELFMDEALKYCMKCDCMNSYREFMKAHSDGRVLRYDGNNLGLIKERMLWAYRR